MTFKPRVVIAEVGTRRNPSSSRLKMTNFKIIISFNGVACDILRSRGPRGFPAVGFFYHKSSQPNLTLSGGLETFDSD